LEQLTRRIVALGRTLLHASITKDDQNCVHGTTDGETNLLQEKLGKKALPNRIRLHCDIARLPPSRADLIRVLLCPEQIPDHFSDTRTESRISIPTQ
jgi:hypothetical protein